jgi:hypothetical protein
MWFYALCNHIIMNSDNDSVPQSHPIQQKPAKFFRSLKRIRLLAVVLFVGALSGVGGYSPGIRNNQSVPLSQTSPSQQATISTNISPTITQPTNNQPTSVFDPNIANWKTYINSELGVSFSYPSDAIARADKVYSMLSSKPANGVIIEPPYQEPFSKWYSFALVVEDNPQNVDARMIIDTYIENIKKICSPPACATPNKILESLKQYENAEINGYIFHIGAETDSVMIVQAKNNKTYIYNAN